MPVDDCVVVGAGPAGLAASVALAARGVAHRVLERGRVGQTWRTQRWASFRLNTPGWMNGMLGDQAPGAYAGRAEIIERLDRLGAAAPVREGVEVTGIRPYGDGYALRTGAGEIRTRTVVVATGDQNVARLPAAAWALPDRIAQCHATEYRSPGALPAGAVLVVGSAQSGCQVAEDLLDGGRRVFLATSPVGRLPTPYRGRDTIEWLAEVGFFAQRPADLPDPAMMRQPMPIVAPNGRELGLPALARRGVTLLGRVTGVAGERVSVDGGAAGSIAAGEAFAGRVRTLVDGGIQRLGVDAPPADPEPDPGDPPPATAELDLRDAGVSAVVWCTGVTGDFGWLGGDLVDAAGQPRRSDAAGPVPGLWYVGLRWLTCRGSAILHGFPADAAAVAGAVHTHLSVPAS
jgi:putative flavoprotein involved in K+ transport